MIVETIHEIISFKQRKWLEWYIRFDTQKRNKARNGFEKDFYEILVNAVFSKVLEDIRNRLTIEFVNKYEICLHRTFKTTR